jgi:hypothetical protein
MMANRMTNTFLPAIEVMNRENMGCYGPVSFRHYLRQHSLPYKDTATAISVDSRRKLSTDLVDSNVMVFRLGNHPGTNHTAFALARTREGWNDFFLEDDRLFSSLEIRSFDASRCNQDLTAFRFLPLLTEPSLVNLALASGLLGEALELDKAGSPIVPATGQSTYTFDVRPFADGPSWTHRQGQVEIDSLFFATRNGKQVVFAVEAKRSDAFDSLAKHKLVYPYLALRNSLPSSMQIVPVYLRAVRNGDSWNFFVCECGFEDSAKFSLSSLTGTGRRSALQLRV